MLVSVGTLFFLTAAAAARVVPRTSKEPVCTQNVEDFKFTGYHMERLDDSPIPALTLYKGFLNSQWDHHVVVNTTTGFLQVTNKTETGELTQANLGTFEVCTTELGSLYLQYFQPKNKTAITEFKICEDEDRYNVYLPATKTTGLSCVQTELQITNLTLPEPPMTKKDTTPKYPLRLYQDKTVLASYGSRRARHLAQRSINEAAQGLFVTGSASLSAQLDQTKKAHSLVFGTMFRNKAQYLKEWIEFHLMVGVSHFLLYDHGSTDAPLDVLQPYITSGLVTYIPWGSATSPAVAAPAAMAREDVKAQENVYSRAMAACIRQEWQTHSQGPCQFAASIDMLRRSYDSAEWLGFLDIDEFLYPTITAGSRSLVNMLGQAPFATADYISILGSNFGTNGHKSTPSGLVTKNYLRRRALSEDAPSPFKRGTNAFLATAEVDGAFPQTFTLPDTFARKALVRPELALYSAVHDWMQVPSAAGAWNEVAITLTYPSIKMNHYAYLSVADANEKALLNGNPMAAFDREQDAFFTAERDEEVSWLVPELSRRVESAAL